MQGVGVSALPHFIANREAGLERLNFENNMLINDIWLVVHYDLRNVPVVRAVMDFLAECFHLDKISKN